MSSSKQTTTAFSPKIDYTLNVFTFSDPDLEQQDQPILTNFGTDGLKIFEDDHEKTFASVGVGGLCVEDDGKRVMYGVDGVTFGTTDTDNPILSRTDGYATLSNDGLFIKNKAAEIRFGVDGIFYKDNVDHTNSFQLTIQKLKLLNTLSEINDNPTTLPVAGEPV